MGIAMMSVDTGNRFCQPIVHVDVVKFLRPRDQMGVGQVDELHGIRLAAERSSFIEIDREILA